MIFSSPEKERRPRHLQQEHYEIEKELALRLKGASREERRELYTTVYDEMFKRVPHHPMLTRKAVSGPPQRVIEQMRFLRGRLRADMTFLEVGPGDCKLSFAIARHVKRVIGIDVSRNLTEAETAPENFELIISDGTGIDVPAGSIDMAFSDQLMEHLHPDDAREQLSGIRRALTLGGLYVCQTPSRLNGPHDISRGFEETAAGFHLKEYTVGELRALFQEAGFSRVISWTGSRGIAIRMPTGLIVACEKLLDALPAPLRRRIANFFLFRALLNICIGGIA